MTDRLLELAREYGVETRRKDEGMSAHQCRDHRHSERPRNDIAMDLLAKLDGGGSDLNWIDGTRWQAVSYYGTKQDENFNSFAEAVTHLAERAKQ